MKSGVKSGVKTGEYLLSLIHENPSITRDELAQNLEITVKGVDWQITKLKKEGRLKREGPAKGGHWEILD